MSFSSGDKDLIFALAVESVFGAGLFFMIPNAVGNVVSALFSPCDDVNSGIALKENVISRLNFFLQKP